MTSLYRLLSLFLAVAFALLAPKADAHSAVEPMAEWTVMVYIAADNDLDPFAVANFTQMGDVGSTPEVNFLVQLDRSDAARNFGTRRYRMKKGTKLGDAEMVLPKQNMGDPKTLAQFIEWGMTKYPAKRNCLVVWSHGSGWRKTILQNPAEEKLAPSTGKPLPQFKKVCYSDTFGDFLYSREVQDAVLSAKGTTGRTLDVVGFDACLMSTVEVWYSLRAAARYGIGSEDLEPATGWPYHTIIERLNQAPEQDPATFCKSVVTAYRQFCEAQRQKTPRLSYTLAAVDLSGVKDLTADVSKLAQALPKDHSAVAHSRKRCLAYGFEEEDSAPNGIDLDYWVRQLAEATDREAVKAACASLRRRLAAFVLAECHNKDNDRFGSAGLTIYFPETLTIWRRDLDHRAYTKANKAMPVDFVRDTAWATFLETYLRARPVPTSLRDRLKLTLRTPLDRLRPSISNDLNLNPTLKEAAIFQRALSALMRYEEGDLPTARRLTSEALSLCTPKGASPDAFSKNVVNGILPALQQGRKGSPISGFTSLVAERIRQTCPPAFRQNLARRLLSTFGYMAENSPPQGPWHGPMSGVLELTWYLQPPLSATERIALLFEASRRFGDLGVALYKEDYSVALFFGGEDEPNVRRKGYAAFRRSEEMALKGLALAKATPGPFAAKAVFDFEYLLGRLNHSLGRYELADHHFQNGVRLAQKSDPFTDDHVRAFYFHWDVALNLSRCQEPRRALAEFEAAGDHLAKTDLAPRYLQNPYGNLFDRATLSAVDPYPEENVAKYFSEHIACTVEAGLPVEQTVSVMEHARKYDSPLAYEEVGYGGDDRILDTVLKAKAGDVPRRYTPDLAGVLEASRIREILASRRVLYYYTDDFAGLVYVVSSDGNGAVELSTASMSMVDQLRQRLTKVDDDPEAYTEQMARLYSLLVRNTLAGKVPAPERTLNIVPHGLLFQIPFAALRDGERCLIDQSALAFLYSLSPVRALASGPTPQGDIGIVYNVTSPDRGLWPDLKASADEGEAIATSFPPQRVRRLTKGEAGRSSVLSALQSCRYVHFATHAFSVASAPALSSIVLSKPGQGSSDPFLTTAEVSQLSLNNEVVSLGACDTGKGPFRGYGAASFAHAFLTAGAKSALVSLWLANDTASELTMSVFYQAIAKGAAPPQALREAQLAARETYRTDIFWAPYVLYTREPF